MGSRWDDDSVAVSRAALGARKQKTVGGGRDVFEGRFLQNVDGPLERRSAKTAAHHLSLHAS
eukprot:8004779-Pyramimonas_sp.AAC.2